MPKWGTTRSSHPPHSPPWFPHTSATAFASGNARSAAKQASCFVSCKLCFRVPRKPPCLCPAAPQWEASCKGGKTCATWFFFQNGAKDHKQDYGQAQEKGRKAAHAQRQTQPADQGQAYRGGILGADPHTEGFRNEPHGAHSQTGARQWNGSNGQHEGGLGRT